MVVTYTLSLQVIILKSVWTNQMSVTPHQFERRSCTYILEEVATVSVHDQETE